jgi:methylmalonyl-CoA mutase, C-terminal domain
MRVWRGLGGNREVPPVEILGGAEVNPEEEGGSRGRHGFPRGSGVERSDAHILVSMASKIRVVIAKPGLDGHDRGAKIIARALRDAGMEVIYTGLHQTPEQIVETAIQEDADAVGVSILSGAHMTLVPRILEGLRENGAEDVLVVLGGTIPAEDAEELKRQGVAAVFTPGAPTSEIVDFLKGKVAA